MRKNLFGWTAAIAVIGLMLATAFSGCIGGTEKKTDTGTDDGNKEIPEDVNPDETNKPPVAKIAVNGTLEAEATIQFSGAESSDPDGNITKYEWDFESDGTFDANGKETAHAYSAAGTFTVVLRVTDNKDATNSATRKLTIAEKGKGESVGELPEQGGTEKNITFYCDGGETIPAPSPAPCGAVWVSGSLALQPGSSQKSAWVPCFADVTTGLGDPTPEYPLWFVSEPLPYDLAIDGTMTIKDRDDADWEVSDDVLSNEYTAFGLNGVYYGSIYDVDGGSLTLVLDNQAMEWAGVATATSPTNVQHHFAYVDGTSYTFKAGHSIAFGCAPDGFLGSNATQFYWGDASVPSGITIHATSKST